MIIPRSRDAIAAFRDSAEPEAGPQTIRSAKLQSDESRRRKYNVHAAIWRWHFYAGLFFAPILLFLAVTGSIYLFDEEIDSVLHRDLHRVEARPDPVLPPAAQLDRVRSAFPGASIASFQPSFEPGESSRVGILEDGGVRTVFVDPYEGTVLGSVVNAATFTEVVRDLHEKFLAGKVGNWIVEVSASWMLVLILTGLYLWWPR